MRVLLKTIAFIAFIAPALGLWAQVSYDDIKAKLAEGESPENLAQMIRAEGLSFDVNRKVLRKMNRDKFPDWLIDLLIDLDQGQVGEPIVSAYGGSPHDHHHYGPHYYNRHSPFYGHQYWWWDYWDYAWYGPASVFGYWGLGHPFGRHYYGYRYLNLSRPSGYVTRGGYVSPHDDNYRGEARTRVVRGDKGTATRAPSGDRGTRVTRDNRGSSSRSSASSGSRSGTRVTRGSGYSGGSSPRSSGGSRSARRK
ncbi:hypothetical protein [Acanthopleuribacter pedis]|uniref:DUF3300 domain-containing protein n=1 Tax=Acanthopleuribacter pedis TaxID=442870 RepID=A0A8J7U155_9BACT|nr:hypothetical protein [Acanthopleuribacter pedis]MBO1317808.1 hypothetical protein [Acanthopleuribacter pedis]